MKDAKHKHQTDLSSYEFQAESMSVQDALIVLAIRLMGSNIRQNPSAKQHIIALARATPRFIVEDYKQTEKRINRFVNWAGSSTMDDLFNRALEKLSGDYRHEALQWASVNAVAQQLSDEMGAMLHHIGNALGYRASEVEASLAQAREKATGDTDFSGET
ncbi:MAG: hypothetical protein PVJ53_04875 [Desulfobacterales bacterium]|jgi:hypothetical protein